jgi:uncharacterized membrane protein YdbT with pleckstrin-like domain
VREVVNELETNLLTGEEVAFQTTKHWFAPVRDSLLAVLLVLGAIVVRLISPTGEGILGSIGGLMDLLATGILIVAIAIILYNVAVYFSAHFGVTNMRVLRYEGILRRRSSETLLGTLTDVKYSQSFLGRTLGFGDLQILTSSGAAGKDDFQTVSNASGLRTAIQEQKARSVPQRAPDLGTAPAAPAEAAPASVTVPTTAAAPASPPNAADEAANALARLDELHKQGLITDEEFAAKRTEILARI